MQAGKRNRREIAHQATAPPSVDAFICIKLIMDYPIEQFLALKKINTKTLWAFV